MSRRERGKEVKSKKTKDKPKCKIYIFTEGDTEEIYLKHYENRQYNVEVISINPEHTDAIGIVKYAKEYIEHEKLDLELGDRGYCVFDSDPKSNPYIQEAFNLVRGSKEKGLRCIFSNPSFEVWYVLHFKDAPHGKDGAGMKKHLKGLIKHNFPEYKETTDIYDYLQDKKEEAIKRAKILHKSQSRVHQDVFSHASNPYTNIFEFIEYMESIKKTNCQKKDIGID